MKENYGSDLSVLQRAKSPEELSGDSSCLASDTKA